MRYLDAESVRRAMPAPGELVELAALALRSLVAGAKMPAKAALDPDVGGVFAHAMPARLRASEVPGGGAPADLLGLKWIAGGSGNRARGLAAMAALVVLDDPVTGAPVAVLEGGAITAARTAALSGVAVQLLGGGGETSARRAVIVGAGVQGRAHAEVLGAVLPGVELAIHDRHPERAEALAREATTMSGVGAAEPVIDPSSSLARGDVVVCATSLMTSPVLGPADVAPEALVIPVDYGAYVRPELVASAATFVVDDPAQFEGHRRTGRLAGWPDPTAILGELLAAGGSPDRSGLKVALHQGPGIADVIVADAVLRRATALGLGQELAR